MGRNVLKSEICDILSVEYPILLAGMGAVPGMPRTGKYYTGTSVELVAAVSNAGGFGVFGAAELTPDQIFEAINDINSLTSKPFGIDLMFPAMIDNVDQDVIDEKKANLQNDHGDYFTWLDKISVKYKLQKEKVSEHMKRAFEPDFVREQFDAALEAEGASAICSGVGTSQWAVDRIHAAGKISVSLIGNVRQAVKVSKMGTDVIVAQGTEAGGHTGRIGTLALVPQVVDAVSPIPVLAAGGIGDGRGAAATLALGAKGIWVGTAFLSSKETSITEECVSRMIESNEDGTFVTRFFTGKTARVLRHPIAAEWESEGFENLGMPFQLFSVLELSAAMENSGDPNLYMLPSGQIAGMIKESRPAKDIFDEMVSTAVKILKGGELEGLTVAEG